MNALSLSMALICIGVDPGPIDAFRANFTASKVDLDYRYRCGFAEASAIGSGRLWEARDLGMIEDPDMEVVGHWSCDGATEGFRFGSPEGIAAEGRKKARAAKVGRFKLSHVPAYEGLFDGELMAGHYVDEPLFASKSLGIEAVTSAPGVLKDGRGPFCWWPTYPFPSLLRADFRDITPVRGSDRRGGYQTEFEVYRRQYNGFWRQIEIYYDASIGYLPRYARLVESAGQAAVVREYYLIEARMCAAGGFVPTEWYATALSFDRFSADHPGYSHGNILEPKNRSYVGHFKTSSFVDRRKPVELDRLGEVVVVNAPGGQVNLDHNPRSLTLSAIKALVGGKLAEPAALPLPTLDVTELNQFSAPPKSRWPFYAAAGVAVIAIAGLAWRRVRVAAFLVAFIGLSGCGQVGKPVTKISAAFKDPIVLYDLRSPFIPMTRVVRNDGNVPLRLIKGDGGCSCRDVDQSGFPATLRPGQGLVVAVRISHGRSSTPQTLPFTFETDQGTLGTTAAMHPLPKHLLSPEAPSATLVEGDGSWTVDLVHRSITKDGISKDRTELAIPPEFELVSSSTSDGPIPGSSALSFEDVKYRLKLKSKELGLQKSIITLLGPDRTILAESSAVWNRIPFLSAAPDSLALGGQPMRAFLRCSDESVELTKVISAPDGVDAVISSPREVTVRLANAAPGIIKGDVLIATTARGRDPLRILVVRYAPAVR